MRGFLQATRAAAVSLLLVAAVHAQTAPSRPAGALDGSDRAGLAAASNAGLLDQRAGSSALAASVNAADRATLAAEQSRHAELVNLRADDVTITHHDICVIAVTAAVVATLIWIF